MIKNIIPKIFYEKMEDGLSFFVDGLGFEVTHLDDDMAVISRDGAKAYLVEDAEYAAKDRPELGMETDDIDALHEEISRRAPGLLHPNLSKVTLRPWGAKEFAALDKTTVCVVFRQWPEDK